MFILASNAGAAVFAFLIGIFVIFGFLYLLFWSLVRDAKHKREESYKDDEDENDDDDERGVFVASYKRIHEDIG